MTGQRVLLAVALPILLIFGGGAADSSPDAILQSKGLTKVGPRYLLEADVNLRANLKLMRQAKAQLESSMAKRTEIEDQIRAAYEQEAQLAEQLANISANMDRNQKVPVRYNDLLAQLELTRTRMRQGEEYIAERNRALESFTLPTEPYFKAVIEVSDKLEAAQKAYDGLAADPEVKSALASLNAGLHLPVKLGPSDAFISDLPSVRQEREKIQSSGVKFERTHGVPVVQVTLNGSLQQKMVIDSGAGIVTLSHEIGVRLGLTEGPAMGTVSLKTADGKVTNARIALLDSVKLGPFTVEKIPCAVMPKGVDGDNLLGDTFLCRFVYRMDFDAGEIHLSPIDPSIQRDKGESQVATRLDPPPTNLADEKVIKIDASEGWVSTQHKVESGRCYRITATGRWTDSQGHDCGPEGGCSETCRALLGPPTELTKPQRDEFYCGQHPRGALICRIGDASWDFYVGTDRRFVAPASGRLSFRMNDDDGKTSAKSGACFVSIAEIEPQWIRSDGDIEIIARIDSKDRLHLTPQGPYWEWRGHLGKVGLQDGYYPTVINGIFWWPSWNSDKTTEKLPVTVLWPAQPERVRIIQVDARRGDVGIVRDEPTEVVLQFDKQNSPGSSQIGCVISTK